MEIERKFLIRQLPEHLEQYPCLQIEQGYLCTDGLLITKKRYCIPLDPYTIELDIFEGDLAPLILAEVEFPSEEKANAFTPPEWFAKDVTYSGKYHNSYMSRYGYQPEDNQ